MRPQRGLTFITVLIVLAIGGGIFWLVGYGPAYWDNVEVKGVLSHAANMCYHERNDDIVKDFVFRQLHQMFDETVEEHGKYVQQMRIDAAREDLQIERSQVPPKVDIWLTYSRTVTLPLIGQHKVVTFTDHATQDLSPVKW